MDIDSELHAPPVCLFIWGAFVFSALSNEYRSGLRCFCLPHPGAGDLSVTLKEYREVDIQVKELDLHSPDLTKRWTVKQGDRLWSIAVQEYGNPADWTLIAEANRMTTRTIAPGRNW